MGSLFQFAPILIQRRWRVSGPTRCGRCRRAARCRPSAPTTPGRTPAGWLRSRRARARAAGGTGCCPAAPPAPTWLKVLSTMPAKRRRGGLNRELGVPFAALVPDAAARRAPPGGVGAPHEEIDEVVGQGEVEPRVEALRAADDRESPRLRSAWRARRIESRRDVHDDVAHWRGRLQAIVPATGHCDRRRGCRWTCSTAQAASACSCRCCCGLLAVLPTR